MNDHTVEVLEKPNGHRFFRTTRDGQATWYLEDPRQFVSVPSALYVAQPWASLLEDHWQLLQRASAGTLDPLADGHYFRIAGLEVLFHRISALTWPRWFEVTETGEVACSPQLAGALERAWTGPLYPFPKRA